MSIKSLQGRHYHFARRKQLCAHAHKIMKRVYYALKLMMQANGPQVVRYLADTVFVINVI